jgi:hypothetical protein
VLCVLCCQVELEHVRHRLKDMLLDQQEKSQVRGRWGWCTNSENDVPCVTSVIHPGYHGQLWDKYHSSIALLRPEG